MQAAAQYAVPQTESVAPLVQAPSAMNTYRDQQLKNLSPVKVIHKLYSTAILALKKDDVVLAQKAINELIVSLNFEHKEIALGLFRLYDYCKRRIREGQANEAIQILEELRDTWAQAFRLAA